MATTVAIGPGSGGSGNSRISLTALFQFVSGSCNAIDYAVSNINSNVRIDTLNLVTGENTLARPQSPEPAGMILIPPTDNAQTIELRRTTTVTGISLAPTAPSMLTFPTAGPGFDPILNLGGNITGMRVAWF